MTTVKLRKGGAAHLLDWEEDGILLTRCGLTWAEQAYPADEVTCERCLAATGHREPAAPYMANPKTKVDALVGHLRSMSSGSEFDEMINMVEHSKSVGELAAVGAALIGYADLCHDRDDEAVLRTYLERLELLRDEETGAADTHHCAARAELELLTATLAELVRRLGPPPVAGDDIVSAVYDLIATVERDLPDHREGCQCARHAAIARVRRAMAMAPKEVEP